MTAHTGGECCEMRASESNQSSDEVLLSQSDEEFAKRLAAEAEMDYLEARQLIRDGDIDKTFYEFLTDKDVLGINSLHAAHVAQNETVASFEERINALEYVVGPDAAFEIARNGEFARYSNGRNEEYMNLVRVEAGKMKYQIPPADVAHFYSIESLTQYASVQQTPNPRMDVSEIFDIRLLRRSEDTAVRYLDSLITDGEVKVGPHEYWGGPRGANITMGIRAQLAEIFTKLGYDSPTIAFSDERLTLKIDDRTRTTLTTIRDAVYAHVDKVHEAPN